MLYLNEHKVEKLIAGRGTGSRKRVRRHCAADLLLLSSQCESIERAENKRQRSVVAEVSND